MGWENLWSAEEIHTLRELYETASWAELLSSLPTRGRGTIIQRAYLMKLRRKRGKRPGKKKGSLLPLLECNAEARYWMGFLLADGHFSASRLRVALSIQDKAHLTQLQKFLRGPSIHVERDGEVCALSIMHTEAMNALRELWQIENRKTEKPPVFNHLTSEELKDVIVGFIDGDGCVSFQTGRNYTRIAIKCHVAWLPILQLFSDTLHSGTSPKAHVTSEGYAIVNICQKQIVTELGERASTLPALRRKWDKVILF